VLKWELDLWYELWDRAGSQGLDTWYDPRTAGVEGQPPPAADTGDVPDVEPEGA
jgi:hypothetical protein